MCAMVKMYSSKRLSWPVYPSEMKVVKPPVLKENFFEAFEKVAGGDRPAVKSRRSPR